MGTYDWSKFAARPQADVKHPEGTEFAPPAARDGCWRVCSEKNRKRLPQPEQCRSRARHRKLTCRVHAPHEVAAQAFKAKLEAQIRA